MEKIAIQPVTAEMLNTLVQLEQQTFTETFREVYTPEDLAAFLQERKSPAAIGRERSHPDTRYFILYHEGTAAGYIKLNLHKQPDEGTQLPAPVMELEKIYVLAAFQGHKLGKALMQHTYQVAAQHQVRTLWLGVWEHNTKARDFYLHEGFEQFSTHTFMVGQQQDTDLLMKKTLR